MKVTILIQCKRNTIFYLLLTSISIRLSFYHIRCIDITSDKLNSSYIEIVNVDDIIGTSRLQCSNSSNWYEYFINDAHRMSTIRKFNRNGVDKFNDFLIATPDNDLPHLYKIKNNHYIGSIGKHRITIAKYIESKKIEPLTTNIEG